MFLRSIEVAFTLCCFLLTQVAAEASKAVEPEYVGVFMLLDPSNGNLVALERQTSRGRVQNKAFGYAGAVAISEVDGEASPIRFQAGQKPTFVVRAASRANDPLDVFGFYKVEPKAGKRQLVVQKSGFVDSKKDMSAKATVAFEAEKYGENSFKISPTQPLLPGEYILGTKGSPTAFCFGIDKNSAGDEGLTSQPETKGTSRK